MLLGDVRGRPVEGSEDIFADAFARVVPLFERICVHDVREQVAGSCQLAEGDVLAVASGNVLDSSHQSAQKRPADRAAVAGMNNTLIGAARVGVLRPTPFEQTASMPRQACVPAHPNRVPQRRTQKRVACRRRLVLRLPGAPVHKPRGPEAQLTSTR